MLQPNGYGVLGRGDLSRSINNQKLVLFFFSSASTTNTPTLSHTAGDEVIHTFAPMANTAGSSTMTSNTSNTLSKPELDDFSSRFQDRYHDMIEELRRRKLGDLTGLLSLSERARALAIVALVYKDTRLVEVFDGWVKRLDTGHQLDPWRGGNWMSASRRLFRYIFSLPSPQPYTTRESHN